MKKELRKLCYVGYVKAMDSMEILPESKRIPPIDMEIQKKHIQEFVIKKGLILTRIYSDNGIGETTVYKQLCEDAIHREFDVLILDSLFCFGTTIHAAADFIEHVMLPTGFRVIILEAGETDLAEYLNACCERFRIAQSQIKYLEKGEIPHRGTSERKGKSIKVHDLPWYEVRQKEIFQEMLKKHDNFDTLESELKQCRAMMKKLKLRG